MKKIILNASKDYNCGYHDGYNDAVEKACKTYCEVCYNRQTGCEELCTDVRLFKKAIE